jgi:hypothetical protein
MEVSLFWRVQQNTYIFERLQMIQSNGVLFKEVSAFQRCSLIEVFLYTTDSSFIQFPPLIDNFIQNRCVWISEV